MIQFQPMNFKLLIDFQSFSVYPILIVTHSEVLEGLPAFLTMNYESYTRLKVNIRQGWYLVNW